MRARVVCWLAALALVISLAAAAVLAPVQQASAQGTAVSGTWTMTNGSGHGTCNPVTGQILSGTWTCTLAYSGAISGSLGTFALVFNPNTGNFEGSTGLVQNATITVGSGTYNATYFASGTGTNYALTPTSTPGLYHFTCTAAGGATGGTVSGSSQNWLVEGNSTHGDGTALVAIVPTSATTANWSMTNGQVLDGTWSGYAYGLTSPPEMQVVQPNSPGPIQLTEGGNIVAQAEEPTSPVAGAISIGQLSDNPGPTMPKRDLGTYIEFSTNIPTGSWTSDVEIRIYYAPLQAAAAGVDETTLKMYWYDGSSWVLCTDTGVNTTQHYVWAIVPHFSIYGVAGDPAPQGPTGSPAWYPSGTANYLYGVWGSSDNDVWAVGMFGTILHYNGTAWSTVMTSGTANYLYGVWGSSDNDVWAVGMFGTILHYDGTAWSTVMTSGTANYLYGVWGSSDNDVWAVGMFGTILHYDGTAWSTVTSGTANYLYGVWGSSDNDVWAVGMFGTILHYDGTAWSDMSYSTPNYLYGVWGSSDNDVWAVGMFGTILHYNGTAWSDMSYSTPNYLYGVWGSSDNDVWAVGMFGTILHYDGTAWSDMSYSTPNYLYGVWGSSDNDVWAVGMFGTILHWAAAPRFGVVTATGTGTASFSAGWYLIKNLTAVNPGTLATPPVNSLVFPDGVFSFDITGVPVGGTVTVYIQLPSGIPANAAYWKYDSANNRWSQIPYTVVSAHEIAITLTDGGVGDSDGIANGTITDPGGLGGPGPCGGSPLLPSIYAGIGAALVAGILGYVLGRRLAKRQR